MKKLKAFTLAEVMIVLGIIGVVAAITIPTLNVKTEEARFIAQLHKAENSLQNALKLAAIDNDNLPINHWESYVNAESIIDRSIAVANVLASHLNVVNDCSNRNQCLGLSYKTLQKINADAFPTETCPACFMTSDGIIYYIHYPAITVDLNGPQKPNILGVDVFDFQVTANGHVEALNGLDLCNINNNGGKNGLGCTEWALRKGNMDYRRKIVSW